MNMREFYTFKHDGSYKNINEDCVYMDINDNINDSNKDFIQLSQECFILENSVAVVNDKSFTGVIKTNKLIGYIIDSKKIKCNNFLDIDTGEIISREFFLNDDDCGKYSNGAKISFNINKNYGTIVNIKILKNSLLKNNNPGTNMVRNINGLLNDLYVNIMKNNASPTNNIPIPNKKYDIKMNMEMKQQICLYYNLLNIMDKISYENKRKETKNGVHHSSNIYNSNTTNNSTKYHPYNRTPMNNTHNISNFETKNSHDMIAPIMYKPNNMNPNIYHNNRNNNNMYHSNTHNNNEPPNIMHLNIHQHSTNNINHIMNLNITNHNIPQVTTKEKIASIKQSKYMGQHPRTLLQAHAHTKGLEIPMQPIKKPYHDGSWIATSSFMGVNGIGRANNSKDAIFMAFHNIYIKLQMNNKL